MPVQPPIPCRICGMLVRRPDQAPEPNVHGSCYIEEGLRGVIGWDEMFSDWLEEDAGTDYESDLNR
jgi:hypothetical protein